MKHLPWRAPAWHARPALRLRFLAELTGTGITVRPIRPPRRYRGGFAVRCTVTPPGVEPREVTIVFAVGSPEVPRVFVDGPTESPHRYLSDGLCMWFPFDGPDQRWLRGDGAAALLGHIIIHLIKEEWWRRTGEWVGAEAPHDAREDQESP
ncbi:hypothetical protein [Dactylosporangium sp. NPDC005555]|uniref:hypothetical protein n=1 Tax=Dactylosporangium sp. NPDC005555 TaxID=3154889 RepID=UPI0033BA0BEE